jgi:hypothetical protein
MAGLAALGQFLRALARSAALMVAVLLAVPDPATAGQAGAVLTGSPDPLPPLPAAAPKARGSNVRGLDPGARALIAKGMQASPTVAALIAALERTDVLVLVEVTFTPRGHAGVTRLVSAPAGYRVVLVSIDMKPLLLDQIMWLGHELQHVREIADAGDVRDEAALRRLMERIGWRTGSTSSEFETDAAVSVGRQVRRETGAAVASSSR